MRKVVRLTENDLSKLVNKIIKEQNILKTIGGSNVKPKPQTAGNVGGANYGPYCRVGTAQGVLKQHATGSSGPNVNMGETGFGLFDNAGKLICIISTKYTQGGYVATSSKSVK